MLVFIPPRALRVVLKTNSCQADATDKTEMAIQPLTNATAALIGSYLQKKSSPVLSNTGEARHQRGQTVNADPVRWHSVPLPSVDVLPDQLACTSRQNSPDHSPKNCHPCDPEPGEWAEAQSPHRS